MIRLRRPGIRGKLLAFHGATILFVVIIELIAQGASDRAGREFESRLKRYHAIQDLRSSVSEFRSLSERYLREGGADQAAGLAADLGRIPAIAASLENLDDEGLDALFEQRAAKRGIEAWIPLALAALEEKTSGRNAWDAWGQAERVAGYVDGYLGKLLSLAMTTGAARYSQIEERNAENRRLALAGIIGAGILAMGLTGFFAASITAPIRRLAEASERMASGDLDVETVDVKSADEVSVLARGFNSMAANIRAMVEGLREKAELERLLHEETLGRVSMGKALREAQYQYLQDQIRPHFLFNALNTIARSSLFENAPRTEKLAHSLARMMRYSLAEGGPQASLSEEFDCVREYLSFQGIRFGTRLSWEIRLQPEAGEFRLPRFTLQPLVENAVRHGIEPKVEGGKVVIQARSAGGRLRIYVADSGTGMDEELLGRLREGGGAGTAGGGAGIGIGLGNIRSRLGYRFGGDARLSISSRKGRGTMVRISLPMEGFHDA